MSDFNCGNCRLHVALYVKPEDGRSKKQVLCTKVVDSYRDLPITEVSEHCSRYIFKRGLNECR